MRSSCLPSVLTAISALCWSAPASAGAAEPAAARHTKAFGDAVVSATERIGIRGGSTIAIIGITGDGETTRFSARLTFDPAVLAVAVDGVRAVPPATCQQLAAPDDDTIEVSTLASGNTTPYVDSLFCEVQFRIGNDAPGGFSPLAVSTTTCQNAVGNQTSCQTRDGSVGITSLASLPAVGSTVVIAGREGQVTESRIVILSNLDPVVGGQTLNFSNCEVTGKGFRLLSEVNFSIAPADNPNDARDTLGVECNLPAAGETYFGGRLSCDTSDAVQDAISYNLACATVRDGEPLPADQVFNNELKGGDQFGAAVAVGTENPDDRVIAVGAPFAGADGTGRVFVLEQVDAAKSLHGDTVPEVIPGVGTRLPDSGSWRVAGVLAPPSEPRPKGLANILQRFGGAVGFSNDRSQLAVGSPGGGPEGRGQVIVFQRPVGGWSKGLDNATMLAPINAPAPGVVTPAGFGAQVGFNDQGELVIGAPDTNSIMELQVGQVYVYAKLAGDFDRANPARIGSPGEVAEGHFGESIAADNGMLVIGAPNEAPDGERSGAAYVVPILDGGPVGLAQPVVPQARAPGDHFGSAVGMVGSTVVIGARGADTVAGIGSGQAIVFDVDPDIGEPIEIATLLPDLGASQGAGARVAINRELIVIGAPDAVQGGTLEAGAVYVFDGGERVRRRLLPVETQLPIAHLENRQAGDGDRFGRAIAMDSRTLLIGVPLADLTVGSALLPDVGRADPFALEILFRSGFE